MPVKRTSDREFVWTVTGQSFVISDDATLQNIIHLVIDCEIGISLVNQPAWKRSELLLIAHNEAEKYLDERRREIQERMVG